MPPRIPTRSQALLLSCTETTVSTLSHTPLRSATAATARSSQTCLQQQTSSFSTTQPRDITRQRKQFWQWLRTSGRGLRDPPAPGTKAKYVESTIGGISSLQQPDMPFPANPEFKSQAVLSEQARELIWKAIMEQGQPIKAVSARYSVDMRRVAAVLRMKAIEKKWKTEVGIFFFSLSLYLFPPFSFLAFFLCCLPGFPMMIQRKKIRLVLKTTPWLEQFYLSDWKTRKLSLSTFLV